MGLRIFACIAAFIWTTAFLPAQTVSPATERVRNLNNQLLAIHSTGQQNQAATVIAQRAAALSDLIKNDPAQALAFSLSPGLLADLSKKFPEAASQLESRGTWRGTIEKWVYDSADLKSFRTVTRMKAGEQNIELHFAGPEASTCQSGDTLQASGVLLDGSMAVASSSIQATAMPSGCSTTGAQKTAVLLVTFPGVTPPANITPQSVYDIFFAGSGTSVNGFWRESSSGLASATGDVFGWYTLTGTYSCAGITQMENDAIAAASATVNFQNYSRVFIVSPDLSPSCGWSGMASIGCSTLNSPAGSFLASTSYLITAYMGNHDQGVELATHEGGHNLGLFHARSRGFGTDILGLLGTEGTFNEYGDRFSTMGPWDLGLYGAPHRAEVLGWLPAVNYLTVQSSGAYSIEPMETNPAGLQALRIQRGTGNNAWLWLEYRQPIDVYDSTLPSQVFTGALVHYEDALTGSHTDLLNFKPALGSWTDVVLAPGNTWTDPYTNLSLSVVSATPTALTVNVGYGALQCVRANPAISVSPVNLMVPQGGSVGYTVTVTNNDTFGCPANTYALNASQPSGWTTVFSPANLSVPAQQTGTTVMTTAVPLGTALASYAVGASISTGTLSAAGTTICTVLPAPDLSVNLAMSASRYKLRQTVSMTASVSGAGTPVAGAAVTFTLTKANGAAVTGQATTTSNGNAIWSYKIGGKDPSGIYSAAAQAISGSQTAASNTVNFSVQ